jgi:hypothetical protein
MELLSEQPLALGAAIGASAGVLPEEVFAGLPRTTGLDRLNDDLLVDDSESNRVARPQAEVCANFFGDSDLPLAGQVAHVIPRVILATEAGKSPSLLLVLSLAISGGAW